MRGENTPMPEDIEAAELVVFIYIEEIGLPALHNIGRPDAHSGFLDEETPRLSEVGTGGGIATPESRFPESKQATPGGRKIEISFQRRRSVWLGMRRLKIYVATNVILAQNDIMLEVDDDTVGACMMEQK